MRRGTLRGRTAIVDDDAFAEAERQARAFDKVLDGSGPRRALIARAAAEVNLTCRQVYNLLKRYAAARTVSSLLPRRGNPRNSNRCARKPSSERVSSPGSARPV